MSEELTIKVAALEPLFEAWEEPNKHRVRAESGEGAVERNGRRPSGLTIAHNLRGALKEWRDNFYFGASETSRHLLNHWFGRAHDQSGNGGASEFRYYFCQREAIETLIYVKEVRKLECLSQLTAEFAGAQAELAALGVTEDEDAWSRYAFKMATGSGKTKVMSLAMVWSYFHALRESESPMARHFVVIAPNLTVFERLKVDFKPEGGGPDIFDTDPLIPVEWRGDWNLSVVLQAEASGASTGGTLYLTNIHQLFDNSKRKKVGGETYEWMGPSVSKAKALDTGAELRDRITSHQRVMLMNDEAHHVWDPDSAHNEAIRFLHETIQKRTGGGLVSQLDFSATPKDNKGNYFKHIICDTPLGEAVDAGIIKTPIIGRAGKLVTQATDNAAYKYEAHLSLGYKRWLKSKEEWEKSDKKPLLFVMCEDTKAANAIAARLNGDALFKELNGRTINLHTNLKGKIKKVSGREVFIESESEISDEDLKALRKLSRELDSGTSPYFCIVSVLMLREGWDVKNVTTIVPLRPYSSKANILPEQTLGRGLRRMTPSGQANEIVAVVEHEAFARLYRDELAQEGLPIEIVDVEKVPTTTVSIFPDPAKDANKLDIAIPRLTAANVTLPVLGPITEDEVRQAFAAYRPLPLGERGPDEVQYEGRHLITGEIVEHMKVSLALLESGIGAVSFYVQELEYIGKVRNTHQVLAPLLQKFFEEILFGQPASLFDSNLVARLSDPDVREHVRATFVPLIRKKTVSQQIRKPDAPPVLVSSWKPYQVTASERRPVMKAAQTGFNLVPCNRSLEQALVAMVDKATDVAAFAKNAGPQALRIDYLSDGLRLAFYTPDFLVRTKAGKHFLIETKGQVDKDVAAKARAAVEWCKSASLPKMEWEYVYVVEGVFHRYQGNSVVELARVCAPSLRDLLDQERYRQEMPLFAGMELLEAKAPEAIGLVNAKLLESLPDRMRKAADEAISLYRFFEKKPGVNFAPVFTALLGVMDEAARAVILQLLTPAMPVAAQEQQTWFEPYLAKVDQRMHRHYQEMARNLRKTIVYKSGLSPLGLLRNCLEFALNDSVVLTGVFDVAKAAFCFSGSRSALEHVQKINDFRNTRVAHQETPLTDLVEAKQALIEWLDGLASLWRVQVDAAYAAKSEVKVLRVRSAAEVDSAFVAEILLKLPEISLPDPTVQAVLQVKVPELLQPLANKRFASGQVHVTCEALRAGSVEVVLILLAGGAFKFLKDYDKLRANAFLLAEDVKRNAANIKKLIEEQEAAIDGK